MLQEKGSPCGIGPKAQRIHIDILKVVSKKAVIDRRISDYKNNIYIDSK